MLTLGEFAAHYWRAVVAVRSDPTLTNADRAALLALLLAYLRRARGG